MNIYSTYICTVNVKIQQLSCQSNPLNPENFEKIQNLKIKNEIENENHFYKNKVKVFIRLAKIIVAIKERTLTIWPHLRNKYFSQEWFKNIFL